jgi:hypothetical protein
MQPVITYFDDRGGVKTRIVEDLYTEDWYNYSTESPIWANAMTSNNVLYVWIPRFAYKVQNFYLVSDYKNVPASAIDIIFLKGTSNYMQNDEILPAGYQVHPAFKYKENNKEKNITGFWVAKDNIDNLVNTLYSGADSAAQLASDAYASTDHITSRLLKNTEWAAIAYLSMHTAGECKNGMSLGENNSSGVFELDVKCFVAAGLEDEFSSAAEAALPFADLYEYSGDLLTYSSYEEPGKKYGDAIIATSTGDSTQSAWFGGTSILPTADAPFIARGIDGNLFAYSSTTNNPDRGMGCRNVLIVE